jgi:hypothetical protein
MQHACDLSVGKPEWKTHLGDIDLILSQIIPVQIVTPYLRSILILSFRLCLGLQSGLPPLQAFVLFKMYNFSYFPCVLHALPISSVIWLS